MGLQVIEGTWEEIKRHEAELIGQYLRVMIKAPKATTPKPSASAKAPTAADPKAKVLRGRGMFAGRLSTEEYFRDKREDTIREDQSL